MPFTNRKRIRCGSMWLHGYRTATFSEWARLFLLPFGDYMSRTREIVVQWFDVCVFALN